MAVGVSPELRVVLAQFSVLAGQMVLAGKRSTLGEEVTLVKYAGCPDQLVVPKSGTSEHVRHIKEFRQDMLGPSGDLTLESKETAHLTRFVDGHLVYVSSTQEVSIRDGWQLRVEMEHNFTTVRRELSRGAKVCMKTLAAALDQNKWVFARTMAYNPHWYALRRKWVGEILCFDTAVLMIRTLGYTQFYGRRSYRCLNVGKHFYWTMGAPLTITILINRKPLPTSTPE